MRIDPLQCLPRDLDRALLIGRVWRGSPIEGPSVVVVRDGEVFDITASAPTTSDLFDRDDVAAFARSAPGEKLGSVQALLGASTDEQSQASLRLLAPCDVQAIKACGVTFAVSLLERVIEEQAGGDPGKAAEIRGSLHALIGTDLAKIRPGSPAAMLLKDELKRRGAWSQYMEVGIGEDAEVFTKSQPMSAVGFGADVGLYPSSAWNNPEPEIVLAVNASGRVVGATLGNDVNLRDFEGRSALLLGKAKDNNGSCAIGPFLRLFDGTFSLDDVRRAEVALEVRGPEGYMLNGNSSMAMIGRDPADIVGQAIGSAHQYPDGFVLFLGTMFAPIDDREAPGQGFTHKLGDIVTVTSPKLGALVNRVGHSDKIPPWEFGALALMRNLAQRGLL
jgi:fumarylacetoacetate (FAA) hydrolase family protein